MPPETPNPGVLLGTGGAAPGLWRIGTGAYSAECLLELPAGHSVYAIDVAMDRGLAAVGTRAGTIEVLSMIGSTPEHAGERHSTLVQGASVLSLCFAEAGRLLSSDTAGRVLLWRSFSNAASPDALEVGAGCVCSLVDVPGLGVVGLASEGELLVWSVPNGRLIDNIPGPKPPSKHALVRLVYWPDRHSVVYPAVDGEWVCWNLANHEIQRYPAHEGDFYAAFVLTGRLVTIGQEDGLLKTWIDETGRQAKEMAAPVGIIAGDVVDEQAREVILVSDSGDTASYRLEGDQLRPSVRWDGLHHRVVWAPRPDWRKAEAERQRSQQARRIEEEICQRLDAGQADSVDALHAQLVDLGFEAVSLGLRARAAAQANDLIGELRTRHHLSQIIPWDDPRSHTSLRRYAELLAGSWHLAEASAILSGEGPCGGAQEGIGGLSRLAEILTNGDWVAEPDVPLVVVTRAASVIDKAMRGRWLLQRLDPIPFPEGGLTAAAVAGRYDRVRSEDRRELPQAVAEKLWWLSRQHAEQSEAVSFRSKDSGSGGPLELVVRILNDGVQNIILPVVILNADAIPAAHTVCAHNEKVLLACERFDRHELGGTGLGPLYRALHQTLRRLRTEANSGWFNG